MKVISKLLMLTILTWTILQNANLYANSPLKTDHYILAQYFGIWGSEKSEPWEKKFRKDTPFAHLNRIYIGFGTLVTNPDGHYTLAFDGPEDRVKDLITAVKKVNPTADIFLFVGGNNSNFGPAANDPKFAENAVNFLSQHGFNGFDIDWEVSLDKKNLSLLVTHLHEKLSAVGYKLTLDVWPFVVSAYDMPVISQNLDQINIMSYGTGLSLAKCVDDFVRAGFPANKIIGGIETEAGYHQFGGKTDTLGENGTIAEKANYVINHGLAGIMAWRMDNDYVEKSSQPDYPTYQGTEALWKLFE